MSETLFEAEFFGHTKGAFTGAEKDRSGYLENAHKGTLFLDEIGNLPLSLQAKLLRVLQEMEFERVGGRERIRVQSRIIAATNKDLRAFVREGRFREDLFYRLNIVAIDLPPLRERIEDLPVLVDHLLAKINIDLHKRIVGVSDGMMEVFRRYPWPGNVRELENLLVRAAVVAKGQVLMTSDFPELAGGATTPALPDMPPEIRAAGRLPTLDEIEEQYIRKVIRESGKNKGEICEILGISRPTFERKLEKYDIVFEKDGQG
jgi:two-component system response regulator AtoC